MHDVSSRPKTFYRINAEDEKAKQRSPGKLHWSTTGPTIRSSYNLGKTTFHGPNQIL